MKRQNDVSGEVYPIRDCYPLVTLLLRELAKVRGIKWWYEKSPFEAFGIFVSRVQKKKLTVCYRRRTQRRRCSLSWVSICWVWP